MANKDSFYKEKKKKIDFGKCWLQKTGDVGGDSALLLLKEVRMY